MVHGADKVTHDHTGATALTGGVLGMGFSLAGQPIIGLIPAIITLAIYLHRYCRWRRTQLEPLRKELAELREENERLKSAEKGE